MKKEDIHITDIKRILLGDAPLEFLLEVFLRSIIAYLALLVVVRLLGKRMSGRLTHTEMAVMLMFGAIVSSAMQIPERGVIEGVFVLALVLVFQRLITLGMVRKQAFEDSILGKMNLLVKDGVLQRDALASEQITRNELFGRLRGRQVAQLGQVKRMYMETTGALSLYKASKPPSGLSILPTEDNEVLARQEKDPEHVVCYDCGSAYPADRTVACEHCGGHNFVSAVK